jgi:hypothetical protein
MLWSLRSTQSARSRHANDTSSILGLCDQSTIPDRCKTCICHSVSQCSRSRRSTNTSLMLGPFVKQYTFRSEQLVRWKQQSIRSVRCEYKLRYYSWLRILRYFIVSWDLTSFRSHVLLILDPWETSFTRVATVELSNAFLDCIWIWTSDKRIGLIKRAIIRISTPFAGRLPWV